MEFAAIFATFRPLSCRVKVLVSSEGLVHTLIGSEGREPGVMMQVLLVWPHILVASVPFLVAKVSLEESVLLFLYVKWSHGVPLTKGVIFQRLIL